METISKRYFSKQRKQFLEANDKLYDGVRLSTKNIRPFTEHQDHQASTWINDAG